MRMTLGSGCFDICFDKGKTIYHKGPMQPTI